MGTFANYRGEEVVRELDLWCERGFIAMTAFVGSRSTHSWGKVAYVLAAGRRSQSADLARPERVLLL
jgi:hypothetical protein